MSVERSTATLELPTHADKGVRCAECAARVCAQVEEITGVLRVDCDPRGVMRVDYDASSLSLEDLVAATSRFGAALESVYLHALWRIGGLDCPDCARTLARSVGMLPGVFSAELNFASALLLVEHAADVDPSGPVVRTVESAGHTAEAVSGVGLGHEGAQAGAAGSARRFPAERNAALDADSSHRGRGSRVGRLHRHWLAAGRGWAAGVRRFGNRGRRNSSAS